MPLSAREFTDITALLKLILNGYPGNAAILREYLQNSDDAIATLQRFVLDERTFSNHSLVDPVLNGTQGPALIAINDGLAKEEDWLALRKINSSSKQADASQTGKNGLGFRASYHLTDNPHILSGRSLMIFDPHHEFEAPHDGGVRIDLLDEGEEYLDQLLPFACYRPSGEGVNEFFNGTAFRLPLRTEDQAKRSKIKPTSTSVEDIRNVFHDFITDELEEVILFLKHITTIEVAHIDSTGQETCLAKVTVDRPIPSPIPASFTRRTTVTSADGNATSRDWKFHCVDHTKAHAKDVMDRRLCYDIEESLTREKLSPMIEMAYPLEGPRVRGRLFTLLPLPQRTEFPLHLNAVFALDPNRQNLKNIQEVGSGRSREKFLVEWNKLIFDTWTPDIWASFLADLPTDVLNTSHWSLWPPEAQGEDCYWKGLVTSLTQAVVDRGLAVFPTVDKTRLVRLDDPNVLLAPSNPTISLDILSCFGVLVIQPPAHIRDSILTTTPQVSELTPSSLHRVLSQRPASDCDKCEESDLRWILDYLAFSPSGNLTFIHSLPWFRLTNDGLRVSLGLRNSGTKYVIPQTQTEATIFSTHPTMLSLDLMSEKLQTALSSSGVLNVGVLISSDIVSFLKQRLGHLSSNEDEILDVSVDHQWIVDFWTWIIEWTDATKFFNEYLGALSSLFLLPTSRGSLRRFSSRVMHFTEGETFVDAWKTLGIYPISPDLPYSVINKLRATSSIPTVRTWPHIAFLIKNCNIAPANVADEVLKSTFKDIRTSLFESLPRSAGSALSSTERTKLKQFPIFMTREKHDIASKLNDIGGYCRYVDIDDHLPLPRLQAYPSAIYVDMRDSTTQSLLRLVEGNIAAEKELQLLQLAVDNWRHQPDGHQYLFIGRIFLNSHQIPPKLRQSLCDIPFVTVNDHPCRVAPKDLIHPRSSLSNLYTGEPAKLPTGRFCEDDYLSIMTSFGFVRSTLDQHVVQDRIQYFSSTSVRDDPRLHDKATSFLTLLDRSWIQGFKDHIVSSRNKAWIPEDGPSMLFAPSKCRDKCYDTHAHRYYYDFTLTILDTSLNASLRDALGWCAAVPLDVLLAQVKSTLEDTAMSSAERSNRLVKMIIYFDKLHSEGHFGEVLLQELRKLLTGRPWVPSNLLAGGVAETQYALLDDTPLKPPFCSIDNRLARLPFLKVMGCLKRPPMSLLLDQLHMIIGVLPQRGLSYPFTSSLGRDAVVAILHEISTYNQNEISQSNIHIPCENERAYPLNDVYFRDVRHGSLSPAIQGKFAAHSRISSALAESLGIPLLSSIALGDNDDDDDEDEEQMSEDLVTRIRGFLRDYDPQYALTEFLANADDAWAKKFSLLLNTNSRVSNLDRVVSPQLQALLESPFLVLYNDAKMSRKDLVGIRRIGTGGKGDTMESHGRHGLGALSFYYFTDVVTIISDDTVMILDPSGSYLPPRKKRGKRTTLIRKLVDFVSVFPDQLVPYDNLFGFSTTNAQYHGTLIILPLRARISEKASDLVKTRRYIESSFKTIAQQSFFFTRLQKITAIERADGRDTRFWEFSASRSVDRPNGDINIQDIQISLNPNSADADRWIIATSEAGEVPQQHLKTAATMKMAPYNVKVQIAVNIEKVEREENFTGFPFSTVPLPKSTSLPFHLNARFAISSNRQSLVINSADSQNQKDAHTLFNTWILESLVPSLYLKALGYLIQRTISSSLSTQLKSRRWWHIQGLDDVSTIFRDAFYLALPGSSATIIKDCSKRWIPFSQSIFFRKEPDEVKALLKMLRVPGFVKSQRYGHISQLDAAKCVDPAFVRQAVLMNAREIISTNGGLTPTHILATLDYLRDEPSLVGLPLLLLASDSRVHEVPGLSQETIYSANPFHQSIFPSSFFVLEGYNKEVMERLVTDNTVNILSLTGDNVITLIDKELRTQTGERKRKWIEHFWDICYDCLPGPPSLDALESSGLLLIQSRASTLSLAQCVPRSVVYNRDNADQEFLAIVQSLGIDIIDPTRNSALDKFLSPRFPDLLDNIIQCIYTNGLHRLSSLTKETSKLFSKWVIRRLPSVNSSWNRKYTTQPITPVLRGDWARLPIWRAYQNGTPVYRSAADVDVLPSDFDIAHVFPFMKQNVVVAPWSAQLDVMIQYCMGRKDPTLSASGVMSKITLPTKLTSRQQVDDMRNFLRSTLYYQRVDISSVGLTAPDQQGYLRPIRELYDSENGLFATTLVFTLQPSFLHPEFGVLASQLRHQGLIHETTLVTFQHCANAVAAAFRQYGPDNTNWQHVREMSTKAFSVYQGTIPSLIWTSQNMQAAWAPLDAIQFVQRKMMRRQGVSYNIQNHYCAQDLPRILAPSQFVLAKFEPIAWTQRALFLSEPNEPLMRSNTALGVPSPGDVVAHLKVLTTVIAHDHPGDLTLLSDIKATYTWLNENANDARVHLQALQDEKIFLNVCDPTSESWNGKWASAKEIVLHLQYDAKLLKYAREFLLSFEPLLLAAGCESLKDTSKKPDVVSSAFSADAQAKQWRDGFNALRLSGQFTDIVLVPTSVSSSKSSATNAVSEYAVSEGQNAADVFVDSAQLRAHRVVLTVAIPHLLTMQTWKEANDNSIAIYGTSFGAQAVLDFVYTGELELSTPTQDEQVLLLLMRDLLEVLPIAEEWDMKDLKKKIQHEIIYKHDMIQRLPHQFDIFLEQARTYNAEILIEELERFERMHRRILQTLKEGQSEDI